MLDFIFEHPIVTTVIAVILIIFVCSIPAMHVETYTVEVTKTEITGDNDYMVFGKDTTTGQTRTFTLNDSFWHGSWDTADLYANLVIGQTYTFRATGWRIPLFSAFPNIIEITSVQ
jgi:hypothetical protein